VIVVVDVPDCVLMPCCCCCSSSSAGPSVGRLGRRDLLTRLGDPRQLCVNWLRIVETPGWVDFAWGLASTVVFEKTPVTCTVAYIQDFVWCPNAGLIVTFAAAVVVAAAVAVVVAFFADDANFYDPCPNNLDLDRGDGVR
jgi:hypothetical protein